MTNARLASDSELIPHNLFSGIQKDTEAFLSTGRDS